MAILSDNLIAYFSLDDGSGSTAVEKVSANNGTWTGTLGSQWGTGKLGGGGVFNGSDNTINITDTAVFRITGDMTIALWVNPTDYVANRALVSKCLSNQPAPYDFYLAITTGLPNFLRGDGVGGHAGVIAGTTAPTTGVWSHVAVTMSGTTATHYLNGATNGSGTLTATIGDGGTAFLIGYRNDGGTIMKGSSDEVGLWNRALTASEISQLYNGGTGRPYRLNLGDSGGNRHVIVDNGMSRSEVAN